MHHYNLPKWACISPRPPMGTTCFSAQPANATLSTMDHTAKRLDLEAKIMKYSEKLDEAETKLAEVEAWWKSEPRSSPLHRRLENLRGNVRINRQLLNSTKRELAELLA
jgi:hypothetical protein